MVSPIAAFQVAVLTVLPGYLILRHWGVWLARYARVMMLKCGSEHTALRISASQALMFFGYLGVNVALMTPWLTKMSLEKASVSLAVINMLPLFFNGRLNPIVNFFGISQQKFSQVYIFAATICLAQTIIHGTRKAAHQNSLSGIAAMCSIASNLVVFFCMKLLGRCGRNGAWASRIWRSILYVCWPLPLAMSAGVSWHLHVLDYPLVSIPWLTAVLGTVLWLASQAIRLWRWLHHGQGVLVQTSEDGTLLKIQLRNPIKAVPCYFFISSGLYVQRLQTQPTPMLWWDPQAKTIDSFVVALDEPIQRTPNQSLTGSVDGPYPERLHLGRYETVLFIAEGRSISRVLPHLLHLAARLSRDRSMKSDATWSDFGQLFNDKTRKIDLYWKLDTNEQIVPLSKYFKKLSGLRFDNAIQAWVFYPGGIPTVTHLPQSSRQRWFPVAGDFLRQVSEAVKDQSRRTPGRAVVVSCGQTDFNAEIRREISNFITADNLISLHQLQDSANRQHSSHLDRGRKRLMRRGNVSTGGANSV